MSLLEEIPFIRARNYTTGRRNPVTLEACTVDLLVIHSMEAAEKGSTAENVAKWFAGPRAPKASAHYCIDNDSIVQCVHDVDTAWHAPGANHNGIGLEHAGYARQTREEWADAFSLAMLARSSKLAAALCMLHDVPIAFVDAEGLLFGQRGVTTHAEISRACRLANERVVRASPFFNVKNPKVPRSNHTDPGIWFPLADYLEMVRAVASRPDTDPAPPFAPTEI